MSAWWSISLNHWDSANSRIEKFPVQLALFCDVLSSCIRVRYTSVCVCSMFPCRFCLGDILVVTTRFKTNPKKIFIDETEVWVSASWMLSIDTTIYLTSSTYYSISTSTCFMRLSVCVSFCIRLWVIVCLSVVRCRVCSASAGWQFYYVQVLVQYVNFVWHQFIWELVYVTPCRLSLRLTYKWWVYACRTHIAEFMFAYSSIWGFYVRSTPEDKQLVLTQ